jgi:hypothetical protein
LAGSSPHRYHHGADARLVAPGCGPAAEVKPSDPATLPGELCKPLGLSTSCPRAAAGRKIGEPCPHPIDPFIIARLERENLSLSEGEWPDCSEADVLDRGEHYARSRCGLDPRHDGGGPNVPGGIQRRSDGANVDAARQSFRGQLGPLDVHRQHECARAALLPRVKAD